MTKNEFEQIAKRTVTDEQYKMIEGLYMESNLDKYEFVKSIKPMLKGIPEEKTKKIVVVTGRDHSGYETTPNGCWYHLWDAEVKDIDIKTGKIHLRRIPGSYRLGYPPFDYSCHNPHIVFDEQ